MKARRLLWAWFALVLAPVAHAAPPANSVAPILGEAPSEATWKDATEIAFARPTPLCIAKRSGNWMRIDCAPDTWVFHFRLLSGSSDGVVLRTTSAPPKQGQELGRNARGASAIFPIEKGDRRLFVVNGLSDVSSYATVVETIGTVSETWVDGEEHPTLVAD